MTSILLYAAVLGVQPRLPDRVAFAVKLAKIKDYDPPSRVRRLLGKPDEIIKSTDGWTETTWRYGVTGKGSIATLARVSFRNNQVVTAWGTDGKASKHFDEASLRKALTRLWEIEQAPMGALNRWSVDVCESEDPLRYIRAANYVSSLGVAKAMALLHEFDRVRERNSDSWLHFLLRILFDVPGSGWMRFPAIGVQYDKAMLNRNSRWPMVVRHGIPYCNAIGRTIIGKGDGYKDTEEWMLKNTHFRPVNLVPPDDPFLVAKQIKDSGGWLDSGGRDELLLQVLRLVRTAYTPTKKLDNLTWADFAEIHQEYLTVGARWDKHGQSYRVALQNK